MNKLMITFCSSFFLIEAIGLSVYLLNITMDNVEQILPWIMIGAINLAFLFVLLSGMFEKK